MTHFSIMNLPKSCPYHALVFSLKSHVATNFNPHFLISKRDPPFWAVPLGTALLPLELDPRVCATEDGILKVAEEEASSTAGLNLLIIDPYNFIDRSQEGTIPGNVKKGTGRWGNDLPRRSHAIFW